MVEYKTVDEQLALVRKAIDSKNFELGLWVDVELENGAEPLTRNTVIEYMSKASSIVYGIYTGAWTWNPIMGKDNPYNQKPLWVADYVHNKPNLPNGWNNWRLWQYTSSERLQGYPSKLDVSRFNGTDEQFRAWIKEENEEPLPPKPPEVQEPLFEARVVTVYPNRLRTRYSPAGVVRPEADWYQSGQVVSVYETKPDWYRTAVETWASAEWLRRLDYQEPPVVDLAYWGPVYNQRDKRWKNLPLGTKSTIGAHGCLITCASMDCNYFGHASNPRQLNEWLMNNEGYLSGNLFLWEKLEELYPDMKFDGFVYYPSEAQIADYIRHGQLPIMHVDFDDSTPLIEMHWVLGIGVEGGNVVIADPWTGAMGKLSDMYPKSVIRFGSYSRSTVKNAAKAQAGS